MGIFPDTMATTKNAESGENCCCVSVAPIRVQFAQCPKVQTVLPLLTADRELVVLPLHTARSSLPVKFSCQASPMTGTENSFSRTFRDGQEQTVSKSNNVMSAKPIDVSRVL